MASRAIFGCLSSSPMLFLLSEMFLSSLRVTQTHFALSSYERALRIPSFSPISGLARLGVKPILCRSSWRVFASTHPLMLPSTSPRDVFFACPPSSLWNLPSFTMELTFSYQCCRFDPPLFAKVAVLAHLDSLSSTSRSDDLGRLLCSFSFWQERLWRSCQLLSL